jgi:hypothetical protein
MPELIKDCEPKQAEPTTGSTTAPHNVPPAQGSPQGVEQPLPVQNADPSHYLRLDALKDVLGDGVIEGSDEYPVPAFPRVAWFTNEEDFEPCMRGVDSTEGNMDRAEAAKQVSERMGLARIKVDHRAAPYRMADFAKDYPNGGELLRDIWAKSAQRYGSRPELWRFCLESVPSGSWKRVEVWEAGQWIPMDQSQESEFRALAGLIPPHCRSDNGPATGWDRLKYRPLASREQLDAIIHEASIAHAHQLHFEKTCRHAAASVMAKHAYELFFTALGPTSLITARAAVDLGHAYMHEEKYALAGKFMAAALAVYKRARGPQDKDTLALAWELAKVLLTTERYPEAKPVLNFLEPHIVQLGPAQQMFREARIKVHATLGEYGVAEQLLGAAINELKGYLPEDHPEIQRMERLRAEYIQCNRALPLPELGKGKDEVYILPDWIMTVPR